MKVLIADDEVYICSLIKHLIDWDGLGLELAGTFCSGLGVLDYLKDHTADILICDIEMPEMNGLELMEALSQCSPKMEIVVISGYRNFEYALSALKFGAINYLLKPIEQKSLNDVLRSIVTKSQGEQTQETVMERASSRLQLFHCIVGRQMLGSVEEINQRYHYNFCKGLFQVLSICFPGGGGENVNLPVIYRMFEEILRPKLQSLCHEFEIFHEAHSSMCVVLNYASGDAKVITAALDGMLQSCIVELSCKTQRKCFIGVGIPVGELKDIHSCYEQATNVKAKFLVTNNLRIFYADPSVSYQAEGPAQLTFEEKNALRRIVEEINPDGVRGWVDGVFGSREQLLQANPWLYLPFCVKAMWQLMVIAEQMEIPGEHAQEKMDAFFNVVEGCSTPMAMRHALTEVIENEINQKLSRKLNNATAYAQGAKEYIDRHYMENVTLKTLSYGLGVNPSYLSVLFKNEMGMNYSEYLLMVRMEEAKKLLRKRELNLSQIANAVGYDRVSYFSKLFKNFTGLKPGEYRRLHQHGLGD